jgi:hypothetical protein
MRRWLAILFMVFMPLQLGWAAVSAYCQHESGAAADHLGHHEHRHQGDDRDSDSKSLGDHFDCGFCHASCITALPSSAASSALGMMSPPIAQPPLEQILSAHPAEPERPKWARPA